jgi:uncharacterized protein YjbI with pentapeptide repeats
MADKAHLEIINQGVNAWNRWRRDNLEIVPNLSKADLNRANLRRADLSKSDLSGADLSKSDLRGAYFSGADLGKSDLSGADLRGAHLSGAVLLGAHLSEAVLLGAHLSEVVLLGAHLRRADLSGVDLRESDLRRADLSGAVLSGAVLSGARLSGAVLRETDLSKSDLTRAVLTRAVLTRAVLNEAKIGWTTFADNDLSDVEGLETVQHVSPSTIGVDTLYRSRGRILDVFLRGCGLSDWQIEAAKLYRPDLTNQEIGDILYQINDLRAQQPIQINSLFISYTHADSAFVNQLEGYLMKNGVRFWRDVHHAVAGRLERQVDRAMRLNPTVLLILSKSSVESDWVEHEARLARRLEKELGRDVLCPIALDGNWKNCRWPERLREQIVEYNILDFSKWQDATTFDRMYRRLIDGLDLFYKQESL